MKAAVAALAATMGSAAAFQVAAPVRGAPSTRSSGMTMAAKSMAIPFMPKPANLDGTLAGDVGFDPLGLSSLDYDFISLMIPAGASMKGGPVDTLYWMREAEIKHCRLAMLAVLGWVATDLGLRFPGAKYEGLSSVAAHDAMVSGGNLIVLMHAVLLLELIGGAAIYQAANGSGRKAGYFALDPLGLSKDPKKAARYELSEVKNGRLAMLAFGGIATQAVLTGHTFPYLF